jgi:hypothetical protein
MMCAALKTKVAYTTRDLLIASRLIASESILHSPGVTNCRPAALYPRRICSCAPGIVKNRWRIGPQFTGDKTDQAHPGRAGPYSPLPPANRPEMRRGNIIFALLDSWNFKIFGIFFKIFSFFGFFIIYLEFWIFFEIFEVFEFFGINTHTLTHSHTHTRTHTHTHTYSHTHTPIYSHTHTHIYSRTHTLTHIRLIRIERIIVSIRHNGCRASTCK